MAGSNSLFSREALDKMRSPDKLDTLLHITTPISWMAVVAILLLLLGFVLWSIMGSFTVKATGRGLITDTGGIRRIIATASGQVRYVYVGNGSHIKKNQQIVDIEQVAATAATTVTKNSIELGTSAADVASRVNAFDSRRTNESVNEKLYSAYEGIIADMLVDEGAMVQAGDTICTIRLHEDRQDLTGIMYVSVDMGKRIEPGMTVQLAPNGADVSQSGSLMGVVRSVSQYPVDNPNLMWNLGNSSLANAIIQQAGNAVVEVRFDLVKNKEDASGYLWTSTVGEHKPITAGTYVDGWVIVDRKAPIEKVFYKITQWLRNR